MLGSMNFDEMKNKAKDMVKGHEDQADAGVDKASQAAKERFGHEGQVDKVTGVAKEQMGLGQAQAEQLGEQAQPPGEQAPPAAR